MKQSKNRIFKITPLDYIFLTIAFLFLLTVKYVDKNCSVQVKQFYGKMVLYYIIALLVYEVIKFIVLFYQDCQNSKK